MRLTKTSDSFGGMVWFRSQDRNDLWLEPCEMTAHDNRRAIDELAAYEDEEEQGRLVILPCKVGDTVFLVEGHSVYKSQVDSITLHDDGLWLDGTFNHFGLVYFSGEIGRNIFLTREEAEAALKGGREDV